MLNQILIKQLSPDVALLYKSFKKMPTNDTYRIVKDRVQRLRYDYRYKQKDDILASKLTHFGNSGQWAKFRSRELAKVLFNNKKPDAIELGTWVTVELECIMLSEKALDKFVSFCRKNKLSQWVTIKNDGSLRPDNMGECLGHDCDGCDEECDGHYCDTSDLQDCGNRSEGEEIGKEIVVTFQKGKHDILTLVCDELTRLGSYVNKSCGMHVHFDARHLTAIKATTLGKRVVCVLPVLKSLLPKSRQENTYCRDAINGIKQGSRYAFVNMQAFPKHGTIEIRGHSGSLNAEKIVNWIALLDKIMLTRNKDAITDISAFITKFKLTGKLGEYVIERYTKFNVTKPVSDGGDDVREDNAAQGTMRVSNRLAVGRTANFNTVYNYGNSIATINAEVYSLLSTQVIGRVTALGDFESNVNPLQATGTDGMLTVQAPF